MYLLKNRILSIEDKNFKMYKYEVWKNEVKTKEISGLYYEYKTRDLLAFFHEGKFDNNYFTEEGKTSTFETLFKIEDNNKSFDYIFKPDYIFYSWEKIYFPAQHFILLKENNSYSIKFEFILPDHLTTGWNYKFDPKYVIEKLSSLVNAKNNIQIFPFFDNQSKYSFQLTFNQNADIVIDLAINSIFKLIRNIENELYLNLEGFHWQKKYLKSEKDFSLEVLLPLLNKIGYSSVSYIHGTDEYGRDFTFQELNKFGEFIYYGLQVKAGDVSGGVNSIIDRLIGQIDDAFKIPHKSIGQSADKYINFYIIAISGKFTKNAKMKILNKLPKNHERNIFFWDKEKILELANKYWVKNN